MDSTIHSIYAEATTSTLNSSIGHKILSSWCNRVCIDTVIIFRVI